MAQSCEFFWATSRLSARRSASGILDAPERVMSSLVMTWIAEGESESNSGSLLTEVTSTLTNSSKLIPFRSVEGFVVSLVCAGLDCTQRMKPIPTADSHPREHGRRRENLFARPTLFPKARIIRVVRYAEGFSSP